MSSSTELNYKELYEQQLKENEELKTEITKLKKRRSRKKGSEFNQEVREDIIDKLEKIEEQDTSGNMNDAFVYLTWSMDKKWVDKEYPNEYVPIYIIGDNDFYYEKQEELAEQMGECVEGMEALEQYHDHKGKDKKEYNEYKRERAKKQKIYERISKMLN